VTNEIIQIYALYYFQKLPYWISIQCCIEKATKKGLANVGEERMKQKIKDYQSVTKKESA